MIWLIFIVIVIAGNLICLWHFIKHLRDKGSKDKRSGYGPCRFRHCGGITEEEKEELLKYLEQL